MKDIKIKTMEGMVQLLNRQTSRKDFISFQSIMDGDDNVLQKLKDFMGPDFHLSPEIVFEEISQFVSQAKRLVYLFSGI